MSINVLHSNLNGSIKRISSDIWTMIDDYSRSIIKKNDHGSKLTFDIYLQDPNVIKYHCILFDYTITDIRVFSAFIKLKKPGLLINIHTGSKIIIHSLLLWYRQEDTDKKIDTCDYIIFNRDESGCCFVNLFDKKIKLL